MIRDLTLIFSVIVSIVSVGFGVYKNIEAGNAKGFAYEQTYRALNVVQQANISSAAKSSIISTVLAGLHTPPPVVDLSRSSAAVPTPTACTAEQRTTCSSLADTLASANVACIKSNTPADCKAAEQAKRDILTTNCIACFTP